MFFMAYGKVVKVHWQLSTPLPPSFHLSVSQKIIHVHEVLHLQNWDLIDTLLTIKFNIFWISSLISRGLTLKFFIRLEDLNVQIISFETHTCHS